MISLQNKNGLYFLFYEVGGHKETIKFENLKHYQQTIHSPSIHNTKQHLLPKMMAEVAQVEKDVDASFAERRRLGTRSIKGLTIMHSGRDLVSTTDMPTTMLCA